jgi:sulfur carrier protein ThiS
MEDPSPFPVEERKRGFTMKVKINGQASEFPPGTTFAQVVCKIRESQKDDPVTQSLIAETGRDHITFILNGRIVRPQQIDSLELKEDDEIRWMHPYAGG